MDEREWQASEDPRPMLEFLRGKASARKLRLFACAWCRYACPHLARPAAPDQNRPANPWKAAAAETLADCRHALAVAERHADGQATDAERHAAFTRAADWANAWLTHDLGLYYDAVVAAAAAAPADADNAFLPPGAPYLAGPAGDVSLAADRAQQAVLLREIVGNPFRPNAGTVSRRAGEGSAVRNLAERIYQGRHFGSLPRLARQLEAASCTDPGLLSHCRTRADRLLGTWGLRRALALLGLRRPPRILHVRGCWAVDLLTGRE